jgi:hypothetical protein
VGLGAVRLWLGLLPLTPALRPCARPLLRCGRRCYCATCRCGLGPALGAVRIVLLLRSAVAVALAGARATRCAAPAAAAARPRRRQRERAGAGARQACGVRHHVRRPVAVRPGAGARGGAGEVEQWDWGLQRGVVVGFPVDRRAYRTRMRPCSRRRTAIAPASSSRRCCQSSPCFMHSRPPAATPADPGRPTPLLRPPAARRVAAIVASRGGPRRRHRDAPLVPSHLPGLARLHRAVRGACGLAAGAARVVLSAGGQRTGRCRGLHDRWPCIGRAFCNAAGPSGRVKGRFRVSPRPSADPAARPHRKREHGAAGATAPPAARAS